MIETIKPGGEMFIVVINQVRRGVIFLDFKTVRFNFATSGVAPCWFKAFLHWLPF